MKTTKTSERIKEGMILRNLKPIELSEITGIPKSAISQYMSGYTNPKQDRIYLISKALNVSETWLMGYDIPMERMSEETIKDNTDLTQLFDIVKVLSTNDLKLLCSIAKRLKNKE